MNAEISVETLRQNLECFRRNLEEVQSSIRWHRELRQPVPHSFRYRKQYITQQISWIENELEERRLAGLKERVEASTNCQQPSPSIPIDLTKLNGKGRGRRSSRKPGTDHDIEAQPTVERIRRTRSKKVAIEEA